MNELKLSDQMVQIIIDALGEYKLRLAGPVVLELQKQLSRQMATPRANGQEQAIHDGQ